MIISASISPLKVARTGSGTSSIRRTVPAAWSPGSPVSTSAAPFENGLLLASLDGQKLYSHLGWDVVCHVLMMSVGSAGGPDLSAE